MLGQTQLGLSCYHSDGYFPPCTRRLQCAWLCMIFCNPLVTWLVSSVKKFVSFMSCFRSFRLRAKAFSRPSILFLEKAECPARKERHSGCFSMCITHSGTCLDPAEEVPPSLSQCCVWDWLGNGSCMVLGGDVSTCGWMVQLELGNKALASTFITSAHHRGQLPDCSKVKELRMDV